MITAEAAAASLRAELTAMKPMALQKRAVAVGFQWKNPDFLLKNPDFLFRNPDFLLKNVDLIIQQCATLC